jgi:formylglycine-generating enzyme required for sulfatase activity
MPAAPDWGWHDNHPIVNVSLNDVLKYIAWFNTKTKVIYRLPTEAEWEYAAKGGNKNTITPYSGSSDLSDVAWFESNSLNRTHPVATKKENALGLFDMSGNVAEWCQDIYSSYPGKTVADPKGGSTGFFRIVRGGSWYNLAIFCENTHREKYVAGARFDYIGFRLAADL